MKRTLTLKNQKGFTLIEIIAVLIILGILAAIAVPKYMSLTGDAADKACIQGVAEGMSQCTNANAQLMLANNGAIPAVAATIVQAGHVDGTAFISGDFSITLEADGTEEIDITSVGITGTPAAGGTATGTWTRPTS